jgi:hypothetical protein
MTIAATVWAWDQKGLEPAERLVLLALADESSDHAPAPDLAHIAEKTEIGVGQLGDICAALRAAGLIDDDARTTAR